MSGTQQSEAMAFISLAADAAYRESKSWARITSVMRDVVYLAVAASMKFDEGDFRKLPGNGSYYFDPEMVYGHAVASQNMSAILALEHYMGRTPIIADDVEPIASHYNHSNGSRKRCRLHVRARLSWSGYRCEVTSIKDVDGVTTAVLTSADKDGKRRLFRATAADVKMARKAAKTEGGGE